MRSWLRSPTKRTTPENVWGPRQQKPRALKSPSVVHSSLIGSLVIESFVIESSVIESSVIESSVIGSSVIELDTLLHSNRQSWRRRGRQSVLGVLNRITTVTSVYNGLPYHRNRRGW